MEKRYPIPLLGPDLVDVRQIPEIQKLTAAPVVEAATAEEKRKPVRAAAPEKTLPPGRAVALLKKSDAKSGAKGDSAETVLARLRQVPGAEDDLDGVTFPAGRWLEVARVLRDELGFDYLSNLTSTDYPDRIEVVYHFYSTARTGEPLWVKVATSRSEATVPSLVPLWEGANWQEREVWDLMGVRFDGHPDLRRILLWEGFAGHPLRKDYQEPYYEEPAKPFGSRWPDGQHRRAEERNPFGRNVRYPHGFDPATFVEADPRIPVVDATELRAGIPDAEKMIVSFGPQHPSTHGVFRMVTTLMGETIARVDSVMGYLHRNHEKIAERNMWAQVMPFTDRLDYLCSMSSNLGYALAVEKLLGVQVPERAEYIRVIMAELTRLVNHMLAIGTLLNDLGAYFTPVLYAFEERELILDLFEMTAGSRMMCNYMRVGGVARDLPDGFVERAKALVEDRLPRWLAEMDRYLTRNEIVMTRTKDIGKLTAEQAINMSVTGPMLRASGVRYDVRRAEPYSIYDRFDFAVPVGQNGDAYDRYIVRLAEMGESIKILERALRDIPAGEVLAGQKRWQIRVPKGEAYARIEAPKGELGFYVVSDGGANPYRYHVRPPSFINLTALDAMSQGHKVADLIAIFGAVDINMGEVDR
ncbi:MAG: NADH-quinone oxidoreductase subunit D [Chloroflexi bacterium]|nr:NADH-quinone oxidoreductase subunit D [Chloroflexota bacterium]